MRRSILIHFLLIVAWSIVVIYKIECTSSLLFDDAVGSFYVAMYGIPSQGKAASPYPCAIVGEGFPLITKSFSRKVSINLCHLFLCYNSAVNIFYSSAAKSIETFAELTDIGRDDSLWPLAHCWLRLMHWRSGNNLESTYSNHLDRMTKEW